MGKDYDCDSPPSSKFQNNWPAGVTSTGETAPEWAWKNVQEGVGTGAIRLLGKVGEVDPPHVVLPLSVEMGKPRLITDARYVNLWCDPGPFTLDSVGQVPETFRRDGLLCNYDHKSGYHAFGFDESEQGYFGFCINGCYFTFAAGCFGWNCMPEIYHVAHMALLEFAQKWFDIPSLGYLDDALSGSLWGGGADPVELHRSARWGVEVLLWLNFLAGYSVSIKKSVLEPCWRITWLGILIDAGKNMFYIPPKKKEAVLQLLCGIRDRGSISVRLLESLAGKCMSLHLAVGEAAKVFTRAFFDVLIRIRQGEIGTKKQAISLFGQRQRKLRESVLIWIRFLDTFDGAPWLASEHTSLRIQTDASGRRWGGVLKTAGDITALSVGAEFEPEELGLDIETKEAMAVVRTLEGIEEVRGGDFLAGTRLNIWIDNLALVFAMAKGASRNHTTHQQLESLFWMKLRLSFTVSPIWWDTKANWEADGITRVEKDDDWRLSRAAFLWLWRKVGPFNMDLMASSVSRHKTPEGEGLPFFSRFHSKGSTGVDLLAQQVPEGRHFCFPHHKMVQAVVGYLARFRRVEVALIVRKSDRSWRPRTRDGRVNCLPLRHGSVKKADTSSVEHEDFECWVLQF
jgi:hypothetical protein